MPIYEYICTACDHRADILLGINDPGPGFCLSCGASGTMRKLFSSPAIHFKGSGWAKKDRGGASSTKAAAAAKASNGSSGGSGGTGGSSDGGGSSSSAPKGDTGPSSSGESSGSSSASGSGD